MSKDKKEEVKKEIREAFKDFNFGNIRYASNYVIDDFLERAPFLNEEGFRYDDEVDLSNLFESINPNSFDKYKKSLKQNGIPLFCFFNQKIKGKLNLELEKYGLSRDTHRIFLFFNCEMDESFEINGSTWPYFYFYQSKGKDIIFKNVPESAWRQQNTTNDHVKVFLTEKTVKMKNYTPDRFLYLNLIFEKSIKQQEIIFIDKPYPVKKQKFGEKEKHYGLKITSEMEHLLFKNSKISRLIVSKEKIKKLTIKNSSIGNFVGNVLNEIPFLEEITFRKVNFKNAFLIKPENQKEGSEKKTAKVIMQDCKFSCNEGEDGIFNKNKLSMQSLGYEAYAMDFSSFANKSRYETLKWTLRSITEKIFLLSYGLLSDYGRGIFRMFFWLIILSEYSYIIYDILIPKEAVKYSLLNSLGFFKFPFGLGFDIPPIKIEDYHPILPALFFSHVAMASIIWYLIIMWLKKRFGQK